MIIKRAH